ncbi:RNA dependent RNA polymerase-domain-containing protein [Xylogone sp. PMI_703]|nr:RNA dependent RNA polymerase-domain-containing protein [Xylogone sp. PMI_703]
MSQTPPRMAPGPQAIARVSGPHTLSTGEPLLQQQHDWQTWPELAVKVRGLHPSTGTWELWRTFEREGNIVFIELFQNRFGNRDGNAVIRFQPPPARAFWVGGYYTIESLDGLNWYQVRVDPDPVSHSSKVQSPTRKHIFYDRRMTLFPNSLSFGVLLHPTSVMPMRTVEADGTRDIFFTIDLEKKKLVVNFKIMTRVTTNSSDTLAKEHGSSGADLERRRYFFEVPLTQIKTIYRVDLDSKKFYLLISVESPPMYFRKSNDDQSSHQPDSAIWTEFESWYRSTAITLNPQKLQDMPLSLHNEEAVIDIGRWTIYRLLFHQTENSKATYDMIVQALEDHNIRFTGLNEMRFLTSNPPEIWNLLAESKDNSIILPFKVRYQLEVCISRNIINEHNITSSFIMSLAELAERDADRARMILEYCAEKKRRIYDPMTIFRDREALVYFSTTRIPHYCAYSRKVTVTPSTLLFNSPTVETTNRVLRKYAREHADGRFLRVQFTGEVAEGRINSLPNQPRNDELYTRVYRTLSNGIRIGERHYEFLAFGNSQFRENSAYFFCPTEDLSCDDIRGWMGDFTHIKCVAKYAARLGQCFSTTRAIKGAEPEIVEIPDIERNGCCFSDGVGKISRTLAQRIASELRILSTVPSVFQFRLAGYKGILVISPDAKEREIHLRKSQQKFTTLYSGLEIIKWSRFSCATLNRQTILILSALGIPDYVFHEMLAEQLSSYQRAMEDESIAVELLTRYVDDNYVTMGMSSMILNGFMTYRDPFVLSLLKLWRAWSIKLLKEKAKIIVENGAFVFGCVDESSKLRGYSKSSIQTGATIEEEQLPEIFIQVPDKRDRQRYIVIEGICLVGRNPSLHPGDIRVVRAIDVPELHHLRDVVVFPQTGDRDIPSMCSGGDLDGDDYFVIWDKRLWPSEWNCEPMNYEAIAPRELQRPVKVTDLMKFFVRYMKNDTLPTIAHAHIAQADILDLGVKDTKCLQLAELHSRAVDYVKSGWPAEMPKDLRPRKWPHFMEKRHKESSTYHSTKILGQLYDRVETIGFAPEYEAPFDQRILQAYRLEKDILVSAKEVKAQYDTAMRRVMAQHDIETEFEVWTAFVLSKPRVGSDYKVQEEIGRVSEALKERFRIVCIEKAGSDKPSILGPFIAAMYQITKEEMDTALLECRSFKIVGGREVSIRKMEPRYMPLMSFPWLFDRELGKIAVGWLGAGGQTRVESIDLDQQTEVHSSGNPEQERSDYADPSQDELQQINTKDLDAEHQYATDGHGLPGLQTVDHKADYSVTSDQSSERMILEINHPQDAHATNKQPQTSQLAQNSNFSITDLEPLETDADALHVLHQSDNTERAPLNLKFTEIADMCVEEGIVEEVTAEATQGESSLEKLTRLLEL